MKRLFVALVAILTTLAAVAAVPAGAQTDTTDVYVVHGVPGVIVDVYAGGNLLLPGFTPETVAGPVAVPAGTLDVAIFAANDEPAATAAGRTDSAVLELSPSIAGDSVSLVAHLGADGAITASAFANDLSPTADTATGRVTIRHTAQAPAVDIVAAGAAVAPLTNIANGSEASVDLPADTYPTGIAAAGTTDVLFDAPVELRPGTNLVVYAIGDLSSSFTLVTQRFTALGSANSDVRAVHGVPGLEVDVYVNGALLIPGFAPKTVSDPVSLAPGDYVVEIFVAAANPAPTSDALSGAAITQTVTVPEGGFDIDLVAHLAGDGTPTLSAFVNDTSTTTSTTAGRISVRHTAAAPAVDIVAAGAPVPGLTNITNGEAGTIQLATGTYPTGIAAAGTTDVLFNAPVNVAPGQNIVVYAIGELGSSFDLIVRSEFGISTAEAYRGSTGTDASIARLYMAILGRNAEPGGFAFWQGQIAAGATVADFVPFFSTSPEFIERFPDVDSDVEFLDHAYRHVLGRPGEPAGVAYWTDRLESGDINRVDMLLFFADSTEFRQYTGTN